MAAVASVLPSVLPQDQILLVDSALIGAMGAMALNLVMGQAGLVSAGNAALLAVGAYTSAALTWYWHAPFPLVLAGAVAAGALIGVVIGLPSLRVLGVYLAIATIALHFIVIYACTQFQQHTVGEAGFLIPVASIGGFQIDTNTKWLYLLAIFTLACFVLIENLRYSKFGRAWMFIRDAPLVAASQGISLSRYKLLAFVVSSSIVCLAGALQAYLVQAVYVDSYSFTLAIQYVAMIIIGGVGSTGGAIAGAFVVILLPTFLSRLIGALPVSGSLASTLQQDTGDLQLIIYGVVIILFLMAQPGGFAGMARALRARMETVAALRSGSPKAGSPREGEAN
jgi:branched-chain amino acid transport system permease protein